MEARVHPLVPAVPGGVDHPALRAGEAEERGLAQVEVRLGQGPLFLFARRRRRRRRGGRGRLLGRRRRHRSSSGGRVVVVVVVVSSVVLSLEHPPRVTAATASRQVPRMDSRVRDEYRWLFAMQRS